MNRMPSMMSTEPLKRPFHNKYVSPNNKRVGSSIFMNGGYINIGTYYATIQVGNPAQNFSVLIDTGSSNIAIPQRGCPTCGGNTTHFYDPSLSSTYQQLTCSSDACNKCSPTNYFQDPKKCVFAQPFCSANNTNLCGQAITYGGATSALTATLAYEQVCFGGLCVKRHNFGMIYNEYPPESFAQPPGMIDGILGLAFEFNACNPTCTTPILNDLYNNQQLPSQVFGVCLTKQNGGYLDLGYVDQTKIDGPIQYTKITHNSWYNIALLDIQVGGTSIGVPPLFYQKTNDVIGTFVDTGTSVILTNAYAFAALQTTFQTYYSNLPGVGGVGQFFNSSNPCITPQQMGNALSSFPPVSFVFPNADNPSQTFTLDVPATDYILFQQGLYCLGIGSASGLGVVLGDPFMNPFYIVFDQQNNRLGFAKAKNCV